MLNSKSSWATLLKDRTHRNNKITKHHIYSSIWSGVKEELSIIRDNSIWLLGNGENINFWNDNWCGTPLSNSLNIPPSISHSLSATVSDFINNGQWSFPSQLLHLFPNLLHLVQAVVIPLEPVQDKLIWKHPQTGDLQLKEAYLFKTHTDHNLNWTNNLWSIDIPPSKSLFVWRLMHQKVPTDENLMSRGCKMASVCNLCFNNAETSFHLFFTCSFATRLWSWLASTLNISLHFNNLEDIWKLCERAWSPQCKVVVTMQSDISHIYTQCQ